MSTSDQYHAIIIGAGQAGVPLSTALARVGWRTALIERQDVGGTCVNRGCTPTKSMVASAEVAWQAGRVEEYGVRCGVHAGPVSVDLAAVRRRKQAIVEQSRQSNLHRIESAKGVDLIYGEAAFSGPHTLEVRLNAGGSRRLSADTILINTGARPNPPPLPGLADVASLDSTSIMELETIPAHLLVLGGGYVGLEFGQMFRRFGSQVTIVQLGERLLDREDPDVADEVAKILRDEGIQILLSTQARSVRRSGGQIDLTLQDAQGERHIAGSHLLLATGRKPNTDSLNLAAAGLQMDQRGFLQVNERLETNVPGIYALGDVKGGPAFTHISYDDFRIMRDNLLQGGRVSTAGRLVPYTVYIDPQLGRVGLSEQEAHAQGRAIRVAKIPMAWIARAIETGDTRGFMKAIVDAADGQILGCAILGTQGGELMSMLEIAMMAHMPYTTLRDAVFAHPTLAESLNTLFTTLDG